MRTLADLLARNAALSGRRPALTNAGRSWTHADHAARITRLRSALAARGIRPGDRVAVLSQNRAEMLEAYGAAEMGGCILVPLNWRLAAPELAAIMADADPAALLFEDRYSEAVAALPSRAPLLVSLGAAVPGALDYEALLAGAESAPGPAPEPEDAAYIIYTSGTTGTPKGAVLSQGAMLHAAGDIACGAGLRPTDRVLITMPLFHVGAKIEWLSVQYMGGSCVLLPRFEPESVFRAIEAEAVTAAHLAPVMVKTLVEHPARTRHDLSTLRRIHYGSAPVPVPDLRRAVAAFGPVFHQLYGMTEHVASTILLPFQQNLDAPEGSAEAGRLASAGQPYHGTSLRIVDDAGQDAPEGEVLVRSAGVMSGYWRNPAQTEAAFAPGGWLRTGDVGRIDTDGFLHLLDRKKDVIVSGGENVHSREVEEACLSHPLVTECAVIGVPDERWGEAVMAYVVLQPGAELEAAALIEHVRGRIASYKKPGRVAFVPDLPRLPHGKVDKKALRREHWPAAGRQLA
ncbi:AMP-dependent synthetase [Roseomonas sp. KE2513]|uniref:class I adenylate-forming enzyme family protein n=1 Tax=Roseomonas sp. KE2513 TaxID=2479202 RepID=UPI0018E0467E|nr:AMP-binding protein [Roseomonas sp. KE2513]MBI0538578.1 AMP-dependent synthetase [Roseomonas sp. KE2513]